MSWSNVISINWELFVADIRDNHTNVTKERLGLDHHMEDVKEITSTGFKDEKGEVRGLEIERAGITEREQEKSETSP